LTAIGHATSRPPHKAGSSTIRKRLRVFVRDNDVDQALRALKKKKKMQRESVSREMRCRKAYEKPSERKTREKTEAIRRARKAVEDDGQVAEDKDGA